jgi:hypothetical protein
MLASLIIIDIKLLKKINKIKSSYYTTIIRLPPEKIYGWKDFLVKDNFEMFMWTSRWKPLIHYQVMNSRIKIK